jgi:FlaA1/EpsC-like NDP-sugar epimerase
VDPVSWIYSRLYNLFSGTKFQRIIRAVLPYRIIFILPFHIVLFTASYFAAFLLTDGIVVLIDLYDVLAIPLMVLIGIRVVVYEFYDLFQGHWRYVSFEDLVNIVRATAISSLLFYGFGMVWGRGCINDRHYIMEMILCIVLVGGVRFIVRNIRENLIQTRPLETIQHIALVGPLKKVQPLLKEFLSDTDSLYRPVAILDPEERSAIGTRISDVPLYTIKHVIAKPKRIRGVKAIVFCWPEASRKAMDRVVEELKPLQVPFKTVPPVNDILAEKVNISDIREVEIDDLLERPSVKTDMEKIRHYLKGKVVLVSGGGGSIGSELCRQIAGFNPKRLVVVERSENSLYDLQLELARTFPDLDLSATISTVNDGPGMHRLLKEERVDVVFHAAAYKHVPLMEAAPLESAYNNILGTYHLAKAAAAAEVKRFVMISTDKAVNPTNVMGVTKRVAEKIVQGFNRDHSTQFMTVRFGNVLGSAGSVIPIFKKQIQQGGPVTVTHPDIVRFFMTIPEAVQLVLQAGCLGHGGEIFVLDMGEPVKIALLAEKLIALSGKRPYEDIDIQYTGLRPWRKNV